MSFLIIYNFYQFFFYIDLDKFDSDNKFIKERRYEVILTSFSSIGSSLKIMNLHYL